MSTPSRMVYVVLTEGVKTTLPPDDQLGNAPNDLDDFSGRSEILRTDV